MQAQFPKPATDYSNILPFIQQTDVNLTAAQGAAISEKDWEDTIEAEIEKYNQDNGTNFDPVEGRLLYLQHTKRMSTSAPYDDYPYGEIMENIAKESETFRKIVNDLVNDTSPLHPTNEIWLGTLNVHGQHTQVKVVVTQEPQHIIDEN